MKAPLLAAVVALCATSARGGAEPAPSAKPSPHPPVFGAGAETVMMDVVVRDKRHQAVRDLQASDFEVFEDGVPQRVEAFRAVSQEAGSSAPASAGGGPGAAVPAATPTLVTFVFDRLTPGGRDMAGRAARTYLAQGRRAGDLVSVFAVDLALHPLLWLSADKESIEAAVHRAVTQGNTEFSSLTDRGEARKNVDSAMELRDRIASATGTGGGTTGSTSTVSNRIGALMAEQLELETRNRDSRAFEKLDRDQQGYATSRSLQGVVAVLARLPGRKTIVLFSEGLATTSTTRDRFQVLMGEANRANVAVYAFDVAGLRILSNTAEARAELAQASRHRSVDGEGMGMITQGLERAEDQLQLNPEAGLGELADRTGGFLVQDTNDARDAFARIGEDMRFHYLLYYTPTNETYDGRFRRVSVRVKRPGVVVRSRDGYRATPPTAPPAPDATREAVAFAALDRAPAVNAFEVKAAALWLPDPAAPDLVPIIVSVPAGSATAPADLTIVARVRDASGQTVGAASQHYPAGAPAAGESAPLARVLYREAHLPPGHYTLEAAAYDERSSRAGVVSRGFDVAAGTATGLRLGSIVLVKGASALAKEDASRPRALDFGDAALCPNLGESVRKSERGDLTFYFAAIAPRVGPAPAEATVEVLRGGQTLRRLATPLSPPNASGRIQMAAALALEPLTPGAYELKVTVGEGADRASSSASFTLED